MRAIALALIAISAASPALAQTAPAASPAQKFDPAPWWMSQPIIASLGLVETKALANVAVITAEFAGTAKTGPDALTSASEQVKTLAQRLSGYAKEKVRIETSFEVSPLYDQYRNKDGDLVDNERPDKITGYWVTAEVTIDVRDVALVEEIYAAVLTAKPSSTDRVEFRLEPDNAMKTNLYVQAVADAARRARLSAEATGTTLGPVRLIDPTGRACETDVLVASVPRGNPAIGQQTLRARTAMDSIVADDSFRWPNGFGVPLQPPLETLVAKACVVYSLGG